jgi:hypothetical protein
VEELTSTNARAQRLAIAALVPASVAVRQLTAQLDAKFSSEPVLRPTSLLMVHVEALKNTNVLVQGLEIAAVHPASVAVRQLTARLDAKSCSEPVPRLISPRMVRVEALTSTNAKDRPLAIVAVALVFVEVRQLIVMRAVN